MGMLATRPRSSSTRAVVVKADDGQVYTNELLDADATRGAFLGGMVGALAGLVAGPVGLLTAGGAVVGGAIAKLVDHGFSEENLAALERVMQPGTSALVVMVERRWLGAVQQALADLQPAVVRQVLPDQIVERLLTQAPEQPAADDHAG